jgi:catechol 2,3-dioxygenase-like lactoylglutathione lyase family enzyme
MREAQSTTSPQRQRKAPAPRVHHVAVQTNDLDNCASWYEDFLGCRPSWSLNRFSELTRSRLPGIRTLTEMAVGDIRLHLFERDGRAAPAPSESVTAFQHLCLAVDAPDDLVRLRQRWIDLFDSGRYSFALYDPPTDVMTDEDGVQSFYAYDVNGLEFEFTYLPDGLS